MTRRDLTPKQQMVLDYMRGNGCALTVSGHRHLISRGSFRNNQALSQVLGALERAGYIECFTPLGELALTEKGKRA